MNPSWNMPITMQSGALATGNGVEAQINDYGGIALHVYIVTTATITFEGYNQALADWVALPATNKASGAIGTTATASGIYFLSAPGIARIRARISAWSSGAVTVIGFAVPITSDDGADDLAGNLSLTQIAAATKVDDAAFTPGTSSVMVAGFEADETGTDSVDEGDAGAARMTLNRRQITASETADDAAPATGTLPSLIGAVCDETATDSVDEGDAGYVRMTAARKLWTENSDLLNFGAGEYETVAESQAGQTLGATGGVGDYLAGLLIVPENTSPGAVQIKETGGSAITVFPGGASSVLTLHPFYVPLGIKCAAAGWVVITGADVSVIGIGNFS